MKLVAHMVDPPIVPTINTSAVSVNPSLTHLLYAHQGKIPKLCGS